MDALSLSLAPLMAMTLVPAFAPVSVTDFEFAYGARQPRTLLPPPSSLPGLKHQLGTWLAVGRACLDNGFDGLTQMVVKEGVDEVQALRHIGALMNAQLSDSEKVSAIAVLMHAWFERVAFPGGPVATH